MVACLSAVAISLASAGNPPFFTTDAVLNAKGELLMTQKGTRHLDIFSADGKSLLIRFRLMRSRPDCFRMGIRCM